MGAAKTLYLLVGAPAQFRRVMDAALAIGGPVRCVERNSNRAGIADDRDPAPSRLKTLHLMQVHLQHGHAFQRSFLILDRSCAFVANQPASTSRNLGNISF